MQNSTIVCIIMYQTHIRTTAFSSFLENRHMLICSYPWIFFYFLTFFNNILSLTRIGFYLQGVTRLGFAGRSLFGRASPHGATDSLYRASACGTTVWPRWRPEPAQRRDGDDVALPVAPHALARQACRAMRAGATRPMFWACAGLHSPTLPFFPSVLPDQSSGELGETFPTLPWRYCP